MSNTKSYLPDFYREKKVTKRSKNVNDDPSQHEMDMSEMMTTSATVSFVDDDKNQNEIIPSKKSKRSRIRAIEPPSSSSETIDEDNDDDDDGDDGDTDDNDVVDRSTDGKENQKTKLVIVQIVFALPCFFCLNLVENEKFRNQYGKDMDRCVHQCIPFFYMFLLS
jgi:hypothetical protein